MQLTSRTPHITDTAPDQYRGYFENEEGEQAISFTTEGRRRVSCTSETTFQGSRSPAKKPTGPLSHLQLR